MWGRVITPLWCLKAPSPATKKWIFEFYTKFGFRNHLQTFWPQWLVKSELSLGLLRELRVYGLRPGQTSHCLQVRDRKWGARGPSGRLASAKLVIHVKYGIFIYLFMSRVNVYLTFRMLLYFRISNSVMLSSDNRNILIIGFSFQGTVLNVFFSVFNVIRYNSNGIL